MTLKALAFCILCASLIPSACAQEQASPEHGRVHSEMRNVIYHFTDSITVHIVHLEGELVPTVSGGMPIFDDAKSFNLAVRSAEISITLDALADTLNQFAFAASDSPIKSVRFSTVGNKVKAAHLPVKGIMDLLGETVAKLIDTRKVRGVRAEKDDLILSPAVLFPPPHIQGRLTSIAIRGNEIVQQYGKPSTKMNSMKISGNYMAYRGEHLRFGKLTMSDTDLTLIDLDPQDPLDFYLEHYQDQLVAGYTKSTPNYGLRAYFRDYNKLTPKQKRPKTSPAHPS